MSFPTGILRYAGVWSVEATYTYGMYVVASDSKAYALGITTNTGTDPTSSEASGKWFLFTGGGGGGGVASISVGAGLTNGGTDTNPVLSSTLQTFSFTSGSVDISTNTLIDSASFGPTTGEATVMMSINLLYTATLFNTLTLTLQYTQDSNEPVTLSTVLIASNQATGQQTATIMGQFQTVAGSNYRVSVYGDCSASAWTAASSSGSVLYNIPPFVIPQSK